MTLLRAVFVLIASWTAAVGSKMPWAKKLNPVACENLLATKALRAQPEIARYDLFLESFKPWRREGDEIVGRAGDWEPGADGRLVGAVGSIEWRVNPTDRRMTYSFRERGGDLGQLATARRIAKAALAAWPTAEDLSGFAVEAAGDRVVTTLPLSAAGVAFVLDAFNESAGFRAFRPLEFERRQFVAREVTRDGCLRFEYDEHREVTVTECTRRAAADWLAAQSHLNLPDGVHFDALAHQITVDYPTPRGLPDVLARGRRIAERAIESRRAGLEVDVRTTITPAGALRVVLPWSPVGLDVWHLLEAPADPRTDYDQPVLIDDLTALELAEVSRVLDGLAPRAAFARSHPEYFLRATPRPPPGEAQFEAARRRRHPGETLPPEMRRNAALARAELLFSNFGPWRRAGEVWTAHRDGVELIVHPANLTLNIDFGRRADGVERAGRVLLALLRTRGAASVEHVRVLDDGRRVEAPLGPVATRVLMETREAIGPRPAAAPTEAEARRVREWRAGTAPPDLSDVPEVRAAAE